jgi:integrase
MICYVFKPARWLDGRRHERQHYSGKLKLDTWAKPRIFALETPDRRIAEMKLQELAKDYEKEALGLLPARSIREALNKPLTDLLGDFLADLQAKGRTPGTLRKYGGTLKILFSKMGWQDLRSVNSRAFVQWRTQCQLSAKSVNDVLANAKGFFRWLRQQRHLEDNPLEFVQRIDTRGHQPCRRALSPKEFATLLQVSPFFRSVVYATALYTGLRRKELNGLQWANLNLDEANPHVRVPASISKNRKDAILPLHPELVAMLRQIMPANAEPAARPFRHHVPRIETLRKDLKAAGIPVYDELGRRIDFHSLRMTFGTTMLANGVHPIVVKELMRHSDLKLTTNLYTDSSQLPLAHGVASLPGIPSPSTTLKIRRTQKRTQIRTQTGVAAGREQSAPVAPGQSVAFAQTAASVAVGHEQLRQSATIRVS